MLHMQVFIGAYVYMYTCTCAIQLWMQMQLCRIVVVDAQNLSFLSANAYLSKQTYIQDPQDVHACMLINLRDNKYISRMAYV